jgi:hypothetical protein
VCVQGGGLGWVVACCFSCQQHAPAAVCLPYPHQALDSPQLELELELELVPDARCQMPDARCLVHGAWCRCQVPPRMLLLRPAY